jgi:putative DNA methylase
MSFAAATRPACDLLADAGISGERSHAIAAYLACVIDKLADFNSSLCVLKSGGGRGIAHTFGRQALPMVWDFAEANPFNPEIASWHSSFKEVLFNAADFSDCSASGYRLPR